MVGGTGASIDVQALKKATMPRLKTFFKDIGYVSWIRYWIILDKSWLYMFKLYKFQTMMGF